MHSIARQRALQRPASRNVPIPPPSGEPTVIIVDPDATEGRFVADLLRALGHTTESVREPDDIPSGAACVLLHASRGATVRADLAKLRQSHPTSPVVLMLAHGCDWPLINEAMRGRAFGVWPKQINTRPLRVVLRDALRSHVEQTEGEPAKIRHALEDANGKITAAAERLEMSRFALRRAMNKHGIVRSAHQERDEG